MAARILISVTLLLSGCAYLPQYWVAAPFENVRGREEQAVEKKVAVIVPGVLRSQVTAILGPPVTSIQLSNGQRFETYTVLKSRENEWYYNALFYDFFTFGFWRIFERKEQQIYVILYDEASRIQRVFLARGAPLAQSAVDLITRYRQCVDQQVDATSREQLCEPILDRLEELLGGRPVWLIERQRKKQSS